jgi:hypothetical protein
MDASGDPQPEASESYFGGVSEPPLTHGWDSSLDGTALTETEARELRILLAQEINDTVSNRKARILRAILTKLDHAPDATER